MTGNRAVAYAGPGRVEVIETGRDVEFIKAGDLCSVPFNIACGRCRNCKVGKTGICLNVNPDRPGSPPRSVRSCSARRWSSSAT